MLYIYVIPQAGGGEEGLKDAEVGLGQQVVALVERHVRHAPHQPAPPCQRERERQRQTERERERGREPARE